VISRLDSVGSVVIGDPQITCSDKLPIGGHKLSDKYRRSEDVCSSWTFSILVHHQLL